MSANKTSQIHIRCQPELKKILVDAARDAGLDLSNYIIYTVLKQIKSGKK